MFERLGQLINRLSVYLTESPFEVLIELALIWLVVYGAYRFLRGTRAARMFKGLGVLLIIIGLLILVLAREDAFPRVEFLYRGFLAFSVIAVVVIFQPELRRALVRLGETRFFRNVVGDADPMIEELVTAAAALSRSKIGAIVAIEREVPLGGIIDAGTLLNAEVSAELLQTIFWPGTALHDMGVVIHDQRIRAAGVQFPLADAHDISQELGSRHRAAIGLSMECDALVVVVSEETGAISLAERGQLIRKLSPEALRSLLRKGLSQTSEPAITQEQEQLGQTPEEPEDKDEDESAKARPERSKREHAAGQIV